MAPTPKPKKRIMIVGKVDQNVVPMPVPTDESDSTKMIMMGLGSVLGGLSICQLIVVYRSNQDVNWVTKGMLWTGSAIGFLSMVSLAKHLLDKNNASKAQSGQNQTME